MSEYAPKDAKPNKLPHLTTKQVMERAQRIITLRGVPPYTAKVPGMETLSDDELAVLSEMAWHWLPFCVLPKPT